eukprot:141183_1
MYHKSLHFRAHKKKLKKWMGTEANGNASQIFESADCNEDGKISISELAQAVDISKDEATKVMANYDQSGNMSLNKQEFKQFKKTDDVNRVQLVRNLSLLVDKQQRSQDNNENTECNAKMPQQLENCIRELQLQFQREQEEMKKELMEIKKSLKTLLSNHRYGVGDEGSDTDDDIPFVLP